MENISIQEETRNSAIKFIFALLKNNNIVSTVPQTHLFVSF